MPAASMPPVEAASLAHLRKRFTREEVERLIDSGFFVGQRYELIDGDLVDKMGQDPPHAFTIRLVQNWLLKILEGRRIQVQLPVEAASPDRERSVPEPDLAVLAAWRDEYQHRHPRGDELILVVQVADSSAAFDLSHKANLYARAGVREYWVLDLGRRMLVIHRQPDSEQYRHIQMHPEEESVTIEGRAESVKVKDLLPQGA